MTGTATEPLAGMTPPAQVVLKTGCGMASGSTATGEEPRFWMVTLLTADDPKRTGMNSQLPEMDNEGAGGGGTGGGATAAKPNPRQDTVAWRAPPTVTETSPP